jgi:TolB protein
MRAVLYALVAAAACGLAADGAAQSAVEYLDSREAFASASRGLSTITFDSASPARGFAKHRPEEGLTVGGVTFRARGGARFGPGLIYVLSAHYGAGNPMQNTGTLPVLGWAAPNRPGNASLDVTLPAGTTAVGCDLWTQQPYAGTVEVTAATADGREHTVVVNTFNRPAAAFVGFVSEAEIVGISFRPPRSQAGLLLDNFTYGRRAEGRVVRPTAAAASQGGTEAPPGPPPAPTAGQAPNAAAIQSTVAAVVGKNQPAANAGTSAGQTPASGSGQTAAPPASTAETPAQSSASATAQGPSSARGTIAYVRGGTEIRLVEADGSNDRQLWTHPYAKEGSAIHNLAWRPDGKELAFSSSHLNVASLYHADLYAVGADGKGFRKLTNAPDHSELARYPKGSVSVTVRNEQPIWKQSRASAGVFFVYVVGADEPQAVTLPPGSSRTLVFKSVADFGDHAQPVVAMYGNYRWFIPGVDVKAGRTIKSPDFPISGDGYELFGAFRPVWRADGSRLSYRNGLCLISTVPAQPTPGELIFQRLFPGEHPSGTCAWDWGPTPALADQILYSSNSDDEGSTVRRVREGGAHPGTPLHAFSDAGLQLLSDLRWLPDGSGFLYTFPDYAYELGNIFRYDFATKRATQLTKFEGEYARAFDVSPDGQWVVFERAKKLDDDKDVDLWLMRTDGTGARRLVRGGLAPSWR